MPLPLLALAGIGAAAGMGGSIFNAAQVDKNNHDQRNFEREMYDKQRRAALDDWSMQNAYNHPLAQMQRLEQAGLNPAMMYGSGSAANVAGGVSPTQARVSRSTAPQLDFGGLGNLTNAAMQQQQFKLNEKAVDAEVALKTAQTAKTMTDAEGGKIDNTTRGIMNDVKINLATQQAHSAWYSQLLNVAKTESETERTDLIRAQTQYTLTQNDVARAMKEPNIQKAYADIAHKIADTEFYGARKALMNSQINGNNFKAMHDEFDLYMKQIGVEKNTPFYWRLFATSVKNWGDQLSDTKSTPFQPMPLIK